MIVVCRVTTECNLACPFCAYDKRLPTPRQSLSAEQAMHLGQLLSAYQQHTGEKVLLSWLGGEPFLWRHLLPITHILHNDYDLAISITTNGTSLHRKLVQEALLNNVAELTISLDGPAELHNQLRGWNNGWQKLKQSIKEIVAQKQERQSELLIRANILLLHDNIDDFSALCFALCAWGINEITFNELGGRDRPEFFPTHKLLASDIDRFNNQFNSLRDSLSDRGVHLRGSDLYLQRIYTNAKQATLPKRCNPGREFLFVDETGRVAPCHFTLDDYSVHLGLLKTPEDIINLRHTFLESRDRALSSACNNCPSTHVFAKFA